MQRPIKFRCYDTKKKKFLDVDDVCDVPLDHAFSYDWTNKAFFQKNRENIIYMQSTGLLDSTGADIYEGDILLGADNQKHIVKFSINRHVQYGHGESTCTIYSGFIISQYGNTHDPVKIIGNVWQHPHLLESEK